MGFFSGFIHPLYLHFPTHLFSSSAPQLLRYKIFHLFCWGCLGWLLPGWFSGPSDYSLYSPNSLSIPLPLTSTKPSMFLAVVGPAWLQSHGPLHPHNSMTASPLAPMQTSPSVTSMCEQHEGGERLTLEMHVAVSSVLDERKRPHCPLPATGGYFDRNLKANKYRVESCSLLWIFNKCSISKWESRLGNQYNVSVKPSTY